jgi:hypothetical protein
MRPRVRRVRKRVKRLRRRLARIDVPTLRAALWAERSLRQVRATLPREGLQTQVAPPPALPLDATNGVLAITRRRRATCLERSLVVQAWLAAHGEHHEIIVGVESRDGVPRDAGFEAHAWVDGFDSEDVADYAVLTRRSVA